MTMIARPLAPAATSKGSATAARIRAVALDQFSQLGFERVTMLGIARAAGVSQPALHYHFADKAQLWHAAMGDLSALIAEEERLLGAADDVPAVVQLCIAMRLFLQLSWEHPALGRIVALEGMAGGERLDWLDQELIGPRLRRLTAIVRQAIADGDVQAFLPEQIVVTLQTGAAGVINLAPLMRQTLGCDPDDAVAQAAHHTMVIQGLLRGFLTEKGRNTLERAI